MGYNIKQKIEICLKAEANPEMTQVDLAIWAQHQYGSAKPPSQTTISRILSSKNDLVASKDSDFLLVRRRKRANPLLRRILTEWITQCIWEGFPITTPIIQLTASAIWNQLPKLEKDGNGVFNHKWCNNFIKQLNIDIIGGPSNHVSRPMEYPLNKVWKLEDKVELKGYLKDLIRQENYSPRDIFTIDEFQIFYSLPLDQIFDVSAIDKGLKQSDSPAERSLTVMLGCNIDGSEKLTPLIVGKFEKVDISQSTNPTFKSTKFMSQEVISNKITQAYQLYYKSNINKWVTSSMFHKYLLTLDHKLQSTTPGRKILILLDDTSTHRILNLNFTNIRLCYLKNNTNHKNPYNSSYYGIKFDYLPMNFGIIEEFRILYRMQQYLEMINLQRINSKTTSIYDPNTNKFNLTEMRSNRNIAMEVLSENDYKIPLIKVIEWIRMAWDNISTIKIFDSWKGTRLIDFKAPWPSSNANVSASADGIIKPLYEQTFTYNSTYNYSELNNIMTHLNVVIPWEIDELIGVVNERCKVTLSYVSIEEIIDSCLLESFDYDELYGEPRFSIKNEDPHSDHREHSSLPSNIADPFERNKLGFVEQSLQYASQNGDFDFQPDSNSVSITMPDSNVKSSPYVVSLRKDMDEMYDSGEKRRQINSTVESNNYPCASYNEPRFDENNLQVSSALQLLLGSSNLNLSASTLQELNGKLQQLNNNR
jgi:hypothetical protein